MALVSKSVEEDLDWMEDWTAFLDGDTISASAWEVNPPDLTIHSLSYNPTTTTVWTSGGRVGIMYELSNRITTANSRVGERSLFVFVEDK